MKDLSEVLGNEVWIKPDYLILRFMKSRKAYKTRQNQPMIFTVKLIDGQVHIHVRFDGRDKWFNDMDTLDFDVYVPIKEFEKLLEMKK